MDRRGLLKLHNVLTAEARALMRVKNHDYGANADPFRNFRRWGLLGILVRLGDKLARLDTFVETGRLRVLTESTHDCVLDIINYAVLFEGYYVDGKGSRSGDNHGAGSPRFLPQGYDTKLRALIRRSGRSSPRSGGSHTFAPAQRAAAKQYRDWKSMLGDVTAYASAKPAKRASAVRGGNKHVGSKHRPGKGKK